VSVVAVRLAIAALILMPSALRRRELWSSALRNPLAAVMGAYYLFATEAFARASAVEVTLLVGSSPVIVVGLERLRGIRPVRQQLIGALVAVLGLLLFLRPSNRISSERALGYVLALCAAAASATYAVGLRRRAQSQRPLDPLVLTVQACVMGSAASFMMLGRNIKTVSWPSPTESVYLVLLGVVCTAVPTLAFGVASARLPSVVTTSLGLMTPLFAALFSGLLLNEWPDLGAIPGVCITMLGVATVLRAPSRRRTDTTRSDAAVT
jgi:drug/metabolite transporter (DMT)-like permease